MIKTAEEPSQNQFGNLSEDPVLCPLRRSGRTFHGKLIHSKQYYARGRILTNHLESGEQVSESATAPGLFRNGAQGRGKHLLDS